MQSKAKWRKLTISARFPSGPAPGESLTASFLDPETLLLVGAPSVGACSDSMSPRALDESSLHLSPWGVCSPWQSLGPPKSTLVCSSRSRTTCFLEAFTEHLLCTRHSAKCWMISLNPRIYSKIQVIIGFPRWQSGKQSTCQFRRCRRPGFHPWVGKTPWVGNGNPLQYSRLANPMDRGGWQATVHGVSRVRHDWAPPPEHTDNNIIPVHQIKELRIEKLNNLLAVIQLDNMIYLSPELFNCRAQTFNHHYPETFSRVGDPASVPWTRIEGSFPDSPNLRNILPAYSLNTPWLWRVKPVLGSRGLQTFSVKSQGVNISGFAGHPDSHNRSALSV